EKSERARSRTPGGREYTPSDPYNGGAVGYPYQHKLGSAGDEAREYAEKSRSFVHANHGEGYGPAYYQVQDHSPRHRSRSESSQRGYELGGMDFAGRGAGMYYENPEAHTYVDLNRKHRETSQPPIAGSDFGTGAIGYGAYHGHGPDPPRLRSKYTADPRAPVNLYVAPNVDSVDGNLLVGDTLSNQKVQPRVLSHPDGSFGTSFAPPQGHRPDHRTYRAPPKPDEPVTFCVSAPKMNGGYSSAPSHQTDVFTQRQAFNDKEVSPHTLLTDEALRPRRREHTPDWVNASLNKQQQWKHLSDPRLDKNLEVYYTEPNWKRNVDQRKNAWERRAFETEQQLQRPKAPASGAPYWANRAEQTHNTWARAADDVNRGGQAYQQQGGVQHHDYSNSQSTQNYSTQQSQPGFGQNYPAQTTTHFSQPLSVGFGGNQMSNQMHSPGGYSVHTQSQSGDKNTGNYATSEHFERERNEDNRHEKSSYTHSESKSTTVNGQPVGALPSGGGQQTFHYANGGVQNSQSQSSHQPSHVVPPSSFQNFKSSSYNTSSNTQNQTTRTLSPRPPLNTGPLTNHHIANGVETDILNTGFNENQIRYFEERHAVPTPHHHHSPLPQKTNTSSSVALPGGGHRYTNFSSESTGVQGGPSYSTNERYSSETRDPNGRSYQTSSFSRSEQKSSSTIPQTWQPRYCENRTASSYNDNFHKESNKRSETTTTSTAPVTRNTTYNYAQQPLSSQISPGQTRYEHYSMKKSEEKKSEETRPIPATPPQPVQETRYEHYSMKKHEEKSEETRPIPLPPPQPVQESRYEHYSMKRHEEKSEETRPIPLPPPQPVQESRYEHYSMKRHEEKSEETRPIPLPPPQPVQESRYEHYSMKRHEEKSEETRPIPLPPPQPVQDSRYEHYSTKRHEEKFEETRPIPLPPPQPVQESRYEHYSMKRHEEQSEETRPIPLPPPQPVQDSRYEHYSTKRHEEKFEETRPIPLPPPQPVQESRYEHYSMKRHEEQSEETRPIPLPPPQPVQESRYEHYSMKRHEGKSEETRPIPLPPPQPVQESRYEHYSMKRHEEKSEETRPIPLPPPQPVQESRYEHYSMKRHEEKSEETRPIPLPPPQPVQESRYEHYSMKRHEAKSEETRPIPLPPPQPVQESRYEHYSMKRHEEKSEETRPIPLPPPQPVQDSRYEHYSTKRHEEKSEETRPIPLPPPQPVQESRYEHYSMKKTEEKKEETRPVVIPAPPPVQTESRYEKYSSNRHEETKTESRPVSQQSNYTESRQQDYHKSSNEKTTTSSTSGAPRVITSVSSNLNNDAFDRKAEMSETLPRGSISNTHNNTQGGYRDHSGHDVSYKRELATSSDPGRDVALLKEEEKRVIEKPLEPGVISRHVTTKYYKKKTTTDTTTTTTPTN
ncbi:pqn-22, partial [Pristionchus pacificus]